MLQSLDNSTTLNRSNTSLASVNPTTSSNSPLDKEEKTQRRRSTFYVPLVIEDDESLAADSCSSNKDEVDKNSTSGSLSSLTSHSTSSKDFKNSSNINLKKSSTGLFGKSSSSQNKSSALGGGSPRSSTTSVKVTTLLFERANSTLGFSTTSSNSSSASSGYRSGGGSKSSTSSKKMAPPCGFNWSLTGVSDDLSGDLDDDSDAAEFIIAMNKSKMVKQQPPITTTPEKTSNSSLASAVKRNSKTSSLASSKSSATTTNTATTNRLSSTSSNKSTLSSNHSTPLPKTRPQNPSSARTKRYGVILNTHEDGGSPRNSLTCSISEHLGDARKSSSSYKSSTSTSTTAGNSSKWPLLTPRSRYSDGANGEALLNTPAKTQTSSIKQNSPAPSAVATKTTNKQLATKVSLSSQLDNTSVSANSSLITNSSTSAATPQKCSEYDDDDDSEISRMQTNTSTPIKMMKSRSRTNILSVPASTASQQSSEQNLINVAKIKASSTAAATAAAVSTSTQVNKVCSQTTPTKQTSTSASSSSSMTPSPNILRVKAKTLPQNLSPSVVLQQGEALDNAATSNLNSSSVKTKKSASDTNNSCAVTSLSRKFGGSQACNLHREGKNAKTVNTIITSAFPPKNLFLLKSTPKLTNTTTSMSSSSDNSLTSPPNSNNSGKNYPPHPHQITSPAKKSLSFIRRAHSTKLSRSNSLLKSIASQHQNQMQNTPASSSSANGGNANTFFCTGSWGKDFYLQYDVCPLALDELDSYFRAEKCAELIRERFKILDADIAPMAGEQNCSGTETLIQEHSTLSSTAEGTIRNIDSSCSSPSDKEQHHRHHGADGDDEDDDDDAGHHSGM
uniref:Uncharacterized protein n=1 Tax=Stomoxys calcitrans TaxID=35570 RepID=A0A1I8Q5M5_STOCA